MKAEHRKEIETNSLAKWLNDFWTGAKRRSAYIWGAVIVGALALIIVWNVWSRSRAMDRAENWMSLDQADSKKRLQEIAEQNRGTIIGKTAKVRLARLALGPEGLDKLGTTDGDARKAAVASIEEGRELYRTVAEDLKENPVLEQEAWLGAAQAEEALMGIPVEGGSGDATRGSFDKVIEYLEKARAVAGDSEPGKEIEKRIADYRENKDKIVAFYADVNRQLYTPKVTTPLGPLPPLPEAKIE